MTEIEKIEKRRAYQREYYKNYRKGKKPLNMRAISNRQKGQRKKAKTFTKNCLLFACYCLFSVFFSLR